MQSKFNFDQVIKDWNKAKNQMASSIAYNSENFFKRNYEKQGFEDSTFTKWKPKKFGNGKPILVHTGVLKASLKIREKTFKRIIIATDVFYGGFHNEGTERLPRRHFVGNSKNLEQSNLKIIMRRIKTVFK